MTRRIRMTVGPHVLTGTLEDEHAPATCAAFVKLLPMHSTILQARWSGEALWIPMGDLHVDVQREHALHRPLPGQLLFHPADASETEILVPYGITAFAAKTGPLVGNHFLTLEAAPEQLARLGALVWQRGEQRVSFELLPVA